MYFANRKKNLWHKLKENSIKTHPKGWKVIKPSGDLSNRRNSRLVELWSCRTAPLIKRVFFYRRNRNMEVVEKLCRICRTIFALQWLCRHAVGPNWWNCFGMRSLPISLAAKLQLWILGCWAKGGGAKWPPTKLTDDVIYKQLPGRFMRIVECLQTVGYLSNLALFLYLFRWFFNIPLGLPLCPLHCVILCYSGANSIDHHIITAHLVPPIWFGTLEVDFGPCWCSIQIPWHYSINWQTWKFPWFWKSVLASWTARGCLFAEKWMSNPRKIETVESTETTCHWPRQT